LPEFEAWVIIIVMLHCFHQIKFKVQGSRFKVQS
jgi:hypothetical protein